MILCDSHVWQSRIITPEAGKSSVIRDADHLFAARGLICTLWLLSNLMRNVSVLRLSTAKESSIVCMTLALDVTFKGIVVGQASQSS